MKIKQQLFLTMLGFLTLVNVVACGVSSGPIGPTGPQGESVTGSPGANGVDGRDGVGVGVDVSEAPHSACPFGGKTLSIYRDYDNSGSRDLEDVVTTVTSVCNGMAGTSSSVSIRVANTTECPVVGGFVIHSSSSSVDAKVCNGAKGDDGLVGPQGERGLSGLDAASVVPVKVCVSDTSTYAEYGLQIGDDLFAVYWGVIPASGGQKTAFWTKLVPGSYHATGGNMCAFTID